MLDEVRERAHAAARLLPALTVPVEAAPGMVLASPFGDASLTVPAGALVTPWVAGFASFCGLASVLVRVTPAVGLLVADDAGWQPGASVGAAGQGPLGTVLPGLVRAAGGEPGPVSWLPDDAMALGIAVEMVDSDEAACDVLVVVRPVGADDHLRATLAEIGADVSVDGIDVAPGGSTLLAVLPGGRLVVGLGSTPADVAAGTALVLDPVLAGLVGAPLRQFGVGVVAEAFESGDAPRLAPATRGRDGWRALAGQEWEVAAAQSFLVVPASGADEGDNLIIVDIPGVSRS